MDEFEMRAQFDANVTITYSGGSRPGATPGQGQQRHSASSRDLY